MLASNNGFFCYVIPILCKSSKNEEVKKCMKQKTKHINPQHENPQPKFLQRTKQPSA